jgi:hypothetical protein
MWSSWSINTEKTFHPSSPESSRPSLSSPIFCFILLLLNGFLAQLVRSCHLNPLALLICLLTVANHPLHLKLLHVRIQANTHPSPIKAKVLTTDTTTLRNVTVLTAHPNSFPLSSHRSARNGQILGL